MREPIEVVPAAARWVTAAACGGSEPPALLAVRVALEVQARVPSELEPEARTGLDAAAIAVLRPPAGKPAGFRAAAAVRAELGSWFDRRARVLLLAPEPAEPPVPGPDPDAELFEQMAASGAYFEGGIVPPPDDWEYGYDGESGPPDGELAWLADLPSGQVDELLAAQRPAPPEPLAAGFTHRDGASGPMAIGFAAGGQLDLMEPCPMLASFAHRAAGEGLGRLSDDELVGYLTAARRMQSWQAAAEAAAVIELDRRRQAQAQRPGLSRAGDHVAEEVAAALTLTGRASDRLLAIARGLARLPMVLSALAKGLIDRAKAEVFVTELEGLSDIAAAAVAASLWPIAGGMTTGQLRHALRVMVASIDPDAANARAERGRAQARVEAWQEGSGNAALAGRELPPAEMIAADKRIDTIARALRDAGADGTLDQLRATVFTALLLGRDPARDVLSDTTSGAASDAAQMPDAAHVPGASDRGGGPGWLAGLTGSVHLTMPAATWLGQTGTAGEAAGLGPLDAHTCRDLADRLAAGCVAWCVTLTDSAGRASAHACAGSGPGPPSDPRGRLRWLAGQRFTRLERGDCGHTRQTPAYQPGPKLRHLIQIRHRTCAAPGCRRPATQCDLDHTIPHDQGGRTCECDVAPLCRRHHQAKQTPGWHLDQPQPGTLIWTTPSGRKYITRPASYPV